MLALAVVLAAAVAIPVLAISPGTFNAGDGNFVAESGTTDWKSAYPASSTPTTLQSNFTFLTDPLKGAPDTTAFGKGSSENDPIPTPVVDGIPPNKSDLTHFFQTHEKVNGDNLLYLGWQRIQDPSGTTNMDFEFNQSTVTSSNGVTKVRTAGDLLIEYHLDNGGANATLSYRVWSGTVWGPETPLAAGVSEGKANAAAIIAANSLFGSALDIRTFGEAGINLTQAGLLPGCTTFGTALLKSRSSDSFSSEIKDFVGPLPVNITNCQPETVKIKKTETVANGGAALSGATMQLWQDSDKSGTINTGDVQLAPDGWTSGTKDCVTTSDGIGNCIFTINANMDVIAKETVPPTGYSLPSPDTLGPHSVVLTSSATTFEFVFRDPRAPHDITVLKKDDSSPPVAVAGATFKLWNDVNNDNALDSGDTVASTDCVVQAPASDGRCKFLSINPGEYLVEETAPPPGYALGTTTVIAVTVSVGSSDPAAITFFDPKQFNVITIVCQRKSATGTASDTLYKSQVTFDNQGPRDSLAASDLGGTGDPTVAQVCGLAKAKFGPKAYGTYSTNNSVVIPQNAP